MPVYEYAALTRLGKNTTGVVDAESPVMARQKLRSSGIFPTSVREVHETATLKKSPRRWIPKKLFGRIRPAEVTMMTRQLATLVGAGFPLVTAIDAMLPQSRSQGLKSHLAKIKDNVVEGNSFASALNLFPGTFSSLYINMVRAGESTGTLEVVLDRLADMMERRQALKMKIQSALAYPVLMAVIGTVVLFLLLAFIVPSITSIFTDMNKSLPAPTQMLMAISDFLERWWWGLFLVMGIFVVAYYLFSRTASGRVVIDRLKLRLPLVGTLVRKLAVARFSRTLGSLQENGVPMLQALEIVKNIAGNVIISDAITEAAVEVGKGHSLGASLGQHSVFPNLFIQMVTLGEQSGELETMLNKVADVFESETEAQVTTMASLLEPLMILVMAVIVGFIVLSICLPIFEMNELVG
ncbi:MAG: type II secretion system protein GspF [Deltaproteobacteria bacterium]|nr:MAG: type II secretion system protein GspF [Deltaproteobacteria bacterium]